MKKQKITRNELIKLRKKFLVDFDNFIRNKIEDEEILMSWLMCGLPDGWNEYDLIDIAEDEELWNDVVECFRRCCVRAGIIQ